MALVTGYIASPFEIWIADTKTPFPKLNEMPSSDWARVGTAGAGNYDESGITIAQAVTYLEARPDGTTGPVLASRTSEDLMITINMWDVSLEQYRHAVNFAEITTIAPSNSVIGTRQISLRQGNIVREKALLVRGPSPYMLDGVMQYQIPRVYEESSNETNFSKGAWAGLSLTFKALEDPDAADEASRFGTLIAQHAEMTS